MLDSIRARRLQLVVAALLLYIAEIDRAVFASRGPEPRPPAPDERSGMAQGRKRRGMLGEFFDFD